MADGIRGGRSQLNEWGFVLTDKEAYAIFYHHKPGIRYYRIALRRSLSLADAISTGWWKIRHKLHLTKEPSNSHFRTT